MRDEGLYLEDIVDGVDAVARFVAGIDKEQFLSDERTMSAVLHKLLVIGEAAAHVSKETRERHPEIEWADVVAFRNFAIHVYFSVDLERVWMAATLDAPLLREQVANIISTDYPYDEDEA